MKNRGMRLPKRGDVVGEEVVG